MATEKTYTVGEAAKLIGCTNWVLQRMFQEKRLPEPKRFGSYRVLTDEDIEGAKKILAERERKRLAGEDIKRARQIRAEKRAARIRNENGPG
jgi:excisionase family DNA binding protein